MTYDDIVALLGYANSNELLVRIQTSEGTEVTGVPTSVDTHVTAHEVFLRVPGADEVEISLSLGVIRSVELA